MSFSEVQRDCAAINKSMDPMESKLKDIEIGFLRAKVAELEKKMENMRPLSPIEQMAALDFPAFQRRQFPEFKARPIPEFKFQVPDFKRFEVPDIAQSLRSVRAALDFAKAIRGKGSN